MVGYHCHGAVSGFYSLPIEQANLLNRLIVLELPSKGLALSTRYPKGDFEFPAVFKDETNGIDATINGAGNHHGHVPKDDFANVVKACFYLDVVLAATDEVGVPESVENLDLQVFNFLKSAMASSGHAPHSDTLATATRYFCIIFAHIPTAHSFSDVSCYFIKQLSIDYQPRIPNGD